MSKYTPVLSVLIYFVKVYQIWYYMAQYTKYGQTWHNMVWPNGPTWPVIINVDQL
jgi:hypothetical protein